MAGLLTLLGVSLCAPVLLLAETLVDGCGHKIMYDESGTLTSKNYPGTYPNYTLCEITIQVPAGKSLYVKLADLDIESLDCESAYLKIYKGSNSVEVESYCGGLITTPRELFLDSNIATIRFESGLHISGRGFLLNYASSDHPDLITCLARSNHYKETEYRGYCPAGCRDIAGEISGDVVEGYRDTSLLCKAAIHAGVIADELGGHIHLTQHKGTSRYRGVLANGIMSKDGSLSDRRFVFNSHDCSKSLTSGHGSEGFSATSSWEWSGGTGEVIHWSPEQAQLNSEGISWASSHQSDREWLEIDLGERKKVTGIVTTGSTLPKFNFFVKSYIISFRKDGPKWRVYKGAVSNEEKTLEGNTNYQDTTRNNLIPPVVARYLRIIPQDWHQRIALKVELFGCALAQSHNSSTHPMWEKTNVRGGKTPRKEEETITEPIPSEETSLGWKIIAIIVPLAFFVVLLLAGICFCATRRNRLKADTYKSTDEQKDCWKQLEQPFVRQESNEFAISYTNDKDKLPKFDLVKCDMEDYQQSLMIGTGMVARKGSTFRPMDTESKEILGTQEIENHYDFPHRNSRTQYALPLTNPEPEYATPIIERHMIRENTFTSESGYNIPAVALDRQHSFSAGSFSMSSSAENSGGDYKTPQSIHKEQGDYDRPKAYSALAALENGDYQKPQMCLLVSDGYSSPRDCLKPRAQTSVTSLL